MHLLVISPAIQSKFSSFFEDLNDDVTDAIDAVDNNARKVGPTGDSGSDESVIVAGSSDASLLPSLPCWFYFFFLFFSFWLTSSWCWCH
jgi:hypothetical protein